MAVTRNMYFSMAFLLVALALSGCGASNVIIEGSFPIPSINKIPATVAVYYDAALREYAYVEYSETGQEEFNIESGQSHMELFNTLLPAVFDRVIFVDNLEDAQAEEVDAVFTPTINDFQLGLPAKTKLGVYEVWIEYYMRLLTRDGENIAFWELRAYGKTPTELFRFAPEGINEAAIVALRDLAVQFITDLDKDDEVKNWLEYIRS